METVLLHKSAFLYVTSIFRLSSFVFANALLTGITKTFVPFYSSFPEIFRKIEGFTRDREGIPPNNLLNYGYAILRAVVARALVTSGLLPTLGIHHHNRYNAYCLADDIMEPYRPYVDRLVYDIFKEAEPNCVELTRELKARLLTIPTLETVISGKRSPLMVAVGQTTASLYKCFSGELRKISYPEM